MERVKFADIRRRVSWGSVFGGVVTVLAISILLALLASSISFFMLDPTSDSPASGIGTNVGIWTVVSLIISMAAGGFVAGKLAGADGYIHGFLVWATTSIITVILTISLAVSAVRMAGNILGSVSSVAGNVISGIGSAVGNGISGMSDQVEDIFGDVDFTGDFETGNVRQDIRQALRQSGVQEFQPEYLQRQMRAVRSDLDRSIRKLVLNPNDADVVINNFLERTKNRTEAAFADVDRNDISKAIANTTSLSRAEADRAIDEYTELINNARVRAREQIENLQESLAQARQNWDEIKMNAREEANSITNGAGRSMLWSFIGLLIAAVIAAFAGHYGTRKTHEGYEV